ncbi:MAG: hypothetical protein IJ131_01735, partial [Eggerthellaceae bacterium]|nr:hypothetical protein [Eggerthellaceae bacterium]
MASAHSLARKNFPLLLVAFLAVCLALALAAIGAHQTAWAEDGEEVQAADVRAIVANMTLDEKISQMIIPAFRTWDGNDVTDLGAVPELASALRAHQYGGVILY